MYIYNRISRFHPFGVMTSHTNAKNNNNNSIIRSGSSYKIKSRKPNSYSRAKSVGVSRSRPRRKLTNENIAFLTELGYEVIKN